MIILEVNLIQNFRQTGILHKLLMSHLTLKTDFVALKHKQYNDHNAIVSLMWYLFLHTPLLLLHFTVKKIISSL